jgi:hypothetical protein
MHRRGKDEVARAMIRSCAAALVMASALVAAPARGDEARGTDAPATVDAWRQGYEAARARMVEGKWREAEGRFRALAASAPSDGQRSLAEEMARLADSYAIRAAEIRAEPPAIRSTDELTLLYASSFLYGAGTGAWFLLQIEPDTALTATLPFAAITAAPILAVATIDGYRKLPRGVPHAISAGLFLGTGQGVWALGYQYARAARVREADGRSAMRWQPESAATVLWGGATLGAVLGGALGSAVVTTPGRVSFVASTTMWSGALGGLTASALLPADQLRREHTFLIGGAGYNAGLLAGILGAGPISPSVARVRIVDLLGIAGGLATAGIYLSVANEVRPRTAEGLAVVGAAAGLASGWYVTRNMPKELPGEAPPPVVVVNPAVTPVLGGATLGVSGAL